MTDFDVVEVNRFIDVSIYSRILLTARIVINKQHPDKCLGV